MRREREMRGITVEEIAEATKIGSRSLRSLEEEHFDQLPGGIFNRGFVRAYARYLGIDEEQAVTDYLTAEAAFQGNAPPAPRRFEESAPLRAVSTDSGPLRPPWPDLVIGCGRLSAMPALAIRRALDSAGLQPQQINYVNAHGTGTLYNDAMEFLALRSIFGEACPPVSVSKGMLGHTLGAAGVIESVLCALAMT